MRIGCCAPLEQASPVAAAGFDFLECTVVSLKPEADAEAFEPIRRQAEQSPVPIEVCNIFLPGDLKIVGPAIDEERTDRYLQTALQRVQAMGADTVVFGSGRSRTIPDGFGREQAEEQIIAFLQRAASYAGPLGVVIAIEPLNRGESNIINTVPEALALARRVGHPSVQVLADLYHMQKDAETLANILEAGPYLRHIHVADTGNGPPGSGSYPYPEFAASLRAAGYTGRVSVECNWNDFDREAAPAVAFLREAFSGF